MSTQKSQPKDKATQPGQRDDLALDPETVADLEPKARGAERIRGGAAFMPASAKPGSLCRSGA